jgi:bifunctional NMN adenylyltransferase/nudix hydrolase
MKEYKHAIFVGRFQPFHNGHLQAIKSALEIAEQVILVIGSYKSSCDIKNPLTYDERVAMIKYTIDDSYVKEDGGTAWASDIQSRVKFVPVRDYYNNDNLWVSEVQLKVSEFVEPSDATVLIGSYKDSSSYYLNLFPQWDFHPLQNKTLNATDIRDSLYSRPGGGLSIYNPYHPTKAFKSLINDFYKIACPPKTAEWLEKNYLNTEKYHEHCLEYQFIQDYKAKWEAAPFPPIFVTTDTVVVCSGHVLVVERGLNPGKGKLALPGGFLKQNERLETGAIRELVEETGIDVDKIILRSSIEDSNIFDYPGRSLRGRTITHGYYLKLKDGKLPRLKAGDDANKAFWISLNDVYSREGDFHEDHFHIINYFIRR